LEVCSMYMLHSIIKKTSCLVSSCLRVSNSSFQKNTGFNNSITEKIIQLYKVKFCLK
jgi:hypothetical protein